MATMSYGFHYDIGKRVGYDISFGNVLISNVSSKDKNRVRKEIMDGGAYTKDQIKITRVEN